jgi:hypothetical protein
MMAETKKEAKKKAKKRQPPSRSRLTFDPTLKGILGLSPEDAKEVRESWPSKRAGGRKEG